MRRPAVLLAYAAFALIGAGTGAGGVLLVEQIGDYGVDRATIGLTFFTGSAGFVAAGASAGALLHRFGYRATLVAGGSLYALTALVTAARPAFAVLVLLQLAVGYATGLLESALNAQLAALPGATGLLNRLHAFFGVGALLGPVLATRVLAHAPWPAVWLVLGLASVPLVVGFLLAHPRSTAPGASRERAPGGLATTALRQPGVLLGAILLTVYVGLELGVGNWAFSHLVDSRGLSDQFAGYAVGGYWLGLTLGRFLISPLGARLGLTDTGLMTTCLVGVAAAAVVWSLPGAAVVGLVLLGFFLGPVFPTTMAFVPRLTTERLAPAAIGVVNAGSVVGGAALPWLAGALAQGAGAWALVPFAAALAVVQLVVWWPLATRARRGTGSARRS
ncbi:MFS transporter [Saccharothrix xinjiangensis]|uniref:MFS transporter n=1 Tax=Saccharothrix xinjiangensis TaxID=204798 RepID=A0ABV9XV87_9PSEU